MSEKQTSPVDTFPAAEYEALLARAFPEDNPDAPILGVSDDVIIAPNLAALLADPEMIVATHETEGQMTGFSLAMPISRMDPARATETHETAYIYYTAITPEKQGEGLVEPLMQALVEKLKNQGYSYVERDSMVENGYADKVQKAYADAIVASHNHINFPEVGPERFFRIDLSRVPESDQ